MKMIFLKNWNVMRVLRLGMGVFIISQGVLAQEWALIAMGGIFSVLAVLNIGCCGTSACKTPTIKSNKAIVTEEITYEEIK